MTATAHWRGHEITHDGTRWIYADTCQPVSENKERPCGHCGRPNRADGHDACLGELPGVLNACCGHGVAAEAFVQYEDGRQLQGWKAVEAMKGAGNERRTDRSG
jgi:hypothetical protein